jgi:hypothetical protein
LDLSTGGRRELRRQLEENPDWESDLLALYKFDIWDAIDGKVPVRQALQLLTRLTFEPMSVWRAKQLGGPELKDYGKFIGWDADTYVLADLIDAMNQNTATIIAINSPEGSKPPETVIYPRPGVETASAKPTETLEDFGSKLAAMFGPGNIGG